MADSLELPTLHVEGASDVHTLVHLLGRHGIQLDKDLGPVVLKNARNDRGVLTSMRTAARASTNRPIGFVIDADVPVAHRWQSVCEHLKDLRLMLPTTSPPGGFVGDSTETQSRVGVWIMPDNVMDEGRLEDLIQTLVPANDPLFELAKSSTAEAVSKGARFRPQDRPKAELHCWLGWQEEPGLSFGTAIKSQYFRHESPAALLFVKWFKKLFGDI